MKTCEWCEEDVSNETTYGFLTYWDKKGRLRSGYWHTWCWDEYWEIRKRPWYKKLWNWIQSSIRSMKK